MEFAAKQHQKHRLNDLKLQCRQAQKNHQLSIIDNIILWRRVGKKLLILKPQFLCLYGSFLPY